VYQLPVTANVVPTSLILVAVMMEAPRSFETSVLVRAKRRNIAEDGILRLGARFYWRELLDGKWVHGKFSTCKNALIIQGTGF
jgi:hypothetical protein